MERRAIGGFEVSVLGLGTSRLASLGSGRSKADARRLIETARFCGINFIDTADTYGSTAAERWVGEMTADDSERWIVATKSGLPTVNLPGPFRVLNQPAKKVKQRLGHGFAIDVRTLRRNIERSLRRLRRERIEVFLLHLPPAGIANDDELHDVLCEVKRVGLIAEFGVSSDSLSTILDVRNAWGSKCTETAVNPLDPAGLAKGPLADFDVIANHVIGFRPNGPQKVVSDAGGTHLSTPKLFLRHAAAVPGVKVVLTGTSNPDHLRENASAFDTPITEADLLIN